MRSNNRARNAAVSAGLALVLLASPALALAEGAACAGDAAVVVDRADFYEPLAGEGDAVSALASRALVQITDEMKYFTTYESHGNYDQGFSSGDGYNALGYYQFDRRYSLVPFLRYCLAYDAGTYAMFEPVVARAGEVADGGVAMYDTEKGELTELGQLVQDAWHAAYDADPAEFALLQDNYAYDNYYRLSESYLASKGISMAGRADCVKGLVWSMTNLFGSGGVRWFLDKAGLSDALSDRAFVNRLVDALVNNIAERYPSQPQYHQGWINRYENERADCLRMLGGAQSFSDVADGAWYDDAVAWAADRDLFHGNDDGTFAPERAITRAEMAAVLYNLAGSPAVDGSVALPSDCPAGSWYADAVRWALSAEAFNGYPDGTFGPTEELTREQAGAVLMNMAAARGEDTSARADLSAYPDEDAVSPWFAETMSWAVAEGVISGSEHDGQRWLDPQQTCSRAVTAAIVMNWLQG